MKNRLFVSVIVLEAVLAAAFGTLRYRAHEAAAHAPIVLGFIGQTEDDASQNGEDRRAKQLAVDELNRAGGIDGHPIVAEWKDGKCDLKTAEQAARDLVADGAVAIFTGSCATDTLAAASITQPARVPLFTSTSPGRAVSFAGDLVYRMRYADASEGEMVAGYLAKNRPMVSLVIVSGTTEAETERRNGFLREAALDGAAVSVDKTVGGRKDVTATLLGSIQRAKPDAVYLNVDDPDVAAQLVKELGWYAVRVPIVVSDDSGQWDGVLVSGEYFWSTNPALAAFESGYKAAYDANPSDPASAAHAYDSVYVAAEVIGRVGTDATAIRDELDRQGVTFETSYGTTWFNQDGDAVYPIHVGDDKFNF